MSPHPDDDRAATMQTLEISVVSIEGLNKYSSYFSRIRPFIALTKLPTQVVYDGGGGGGGGTRDHVFRVPVDPAFFSDTYSCLHLQLYNNRRIVGPTKLGWCMIPPSDIASLPPTIPCAASVTGYGPQTVPGATSSSTSPSDCNEEDHVPLFPGSRHRTRVKPLLGYP